MFMVCIQIQIQHVRLATFSELKPRSFIVINVFCACPEQEPVDSKFESSPLSSTYTPPDIVDHEPKLGVDLGARGTTTPTDVSCRAPLSGACDTHPGDDICHIDLVQLCQSLEPVPELGKRRSAYDHTAFTISTPSFRERLVDVQTQYPNATHDATMLVSATSSSANVGHICTQRSTNNAEIDFAPSSTTPWQAKPYCDASVRIQNTRMLLISASHVKWILDVYDISYQFSHMFALWLFPGLTAATHISHPQKADVFALSYAIIDQFECSQLYNLCLAYATIPFASACYQQFYQEHDRRKGLPHLLSFCTCRLHYRIAQTYQTLKFR